MEWQTSTEPVSYDAAMAAMAQRVSFIQRGEAAELNWLLEHPPLYTAGTSAKETDLLRAEFPVFKTGRGGQYTYHGPGQRIVYVMRDLKKHPPGEDLRAYVCGLEKWIIATLAAFGIEGFTREGRIGVWAATPTGEAKIAALGVRVQRWVTSHGIALNVRPDLSHYAGIVPCGISEFGVTSMAALGRDAPMAEVDAALKKTFGEVFA
ncbi:MAG: lipoyl(octanoyl) transferase LipB [Alphaproteobacteria bacterium]